MTIPNEKRWEKLCDLLVEMDTSIGWTLTQAKETIWMSVLDSMNDIWPSMQIIFE